MTSKVNRILIGSTLVLSGLFMVLVVLVLAFKVPTATEDNIQPVSGVVSHIWEAGEYDVVFQLRGHNTTYYINRGIELGIDLERIKTELIGEEVTIEFVDYNTLFPGAQNVHLAVLKHDGKIIYSELNGKIQIAGINE